MVNDRSRPTSEQVRRLAVVYIRQSSPGQVVNNIESRELQYEFVERAVSLGWDRERVVIIDQDQGRRGQNQKVNATATGNANQITAQGV